MNLSGREKVLAFGVLGIALLLFLDQYALTPLLDHGDALMIQREQINADIRRGQKLFSERKQMTPKWNQIVSAGLLRDPAEAESQVLHALRDWAKEAGFILTSIKPERPESKAELKEIQILATGNAPMDGVAMFMYRIQSAGFPLKVTEIQLGTHNENSADLALQVKVSTLYYVPESKTAKPDKVAGGGDK